MQIEVPYGSIRYRRLEELARSAAPKAHRTWRLLQNLLVLSCCAAFLGITEYRDELYDWMLRSAGIPQGAEVAYIGLAVLLAQLSPLVGLATGSVLLRRIYISPTEGRANSDKTLPLTTDDGGIRIDTDEIDYYLKWQGISQMQIEHDGVALHGAMILLVPDAAFPDARTRLAFIREVYDHLGEKARSVSEKSIRPVLDRGA